MRKASLALVTAFLISSLAPSPTYATDEWTPEASPNWVPGFQVDWDNGRDLVLITEDHIEPTSTAFSRDRDGKMTACDDVTAQLNCGLSNSASIFGAALLPVCSDVIESCIEKVWIYNSTSSKSEAVFSRTIPGASLPGYPTLGLPRGDGSHVFTAQLAHSAGTQEYTVQAKLGFGTNPQRQVTTQEFIVRVVPTIERSDSRGRKPSFKICETPDGKGLSPCIDGGPSECVYMGEGICGRGQNFAPNTKIAIQLKLTNELTGWFRGRLKDPIIEVQKIDERYNLVTVEAEPVEIARFFTPAAVSEGAPNILGKPNEISHGAGYSLFNASSAKALELVNGYRDWVKDKAAGVSTVWTFTAVDGNQASGGNSQGSYCLSDKTRLLGIVTTNAMAFEGGAPRYNGGFLSYNVAGMHYLPDGKQEVLGTYDLVLRSDVARCLYGFSNAPVSATISVTGGDSTNVATTVVSEKNGWLKLAAYGFTFSSKEIKVQLSQQKEVVSQPKVTPKKTTITCVTIKKPLRSKKVTAVSPKCPSGYKKK